MGELSPILRSLEGGVVAFRCPGCGDVHNLGVGAGPGPRWTYNGNPNAPTFHPSVLATSGHYCSGHTGECWCTPDPDGGEWPFKCYRCHSFVRDGRIEFLADSTHALAGQTVDLIPFDK